MRNVLLLEKAIRTLDFDPALWRQDYYAILNVDTGRETFNIMGMVCHLIGDEPIYRDEPLPLSPTESWLSPAWRVWYNAGTAITTIFDRACDVLGLSEDEGELLTNAKTIGEMLELLRSWEKEEKEREQ